jgi:bifunctional non-homologous end joining protein LigD
LNTRVSYEVTRPVAKSVAEFLAREHPKLVIAEMAKASRAGKVLIDWSQNSDFKTTVSVYSLRAKRAAPYVSMPVSWEMLRRARLRKDRQSLDFKAAEALERVQKTGDLFAPALQLKQRLSANFAKRLQTA